MVAQHHDRPALGMLLYEIEHGDGVRAVADEVAQECEALGAERSGVRKARGERLQVAVNVGEKSQLHSPLFIHIGSLSWSRIAGFSSVETSCLISSPLAIERSRRRMILPERVFGRLSPKRISFGFAIAPISLPTQSRSSLAIFCASAPLGRTPFS